MREQQAEGYDIPAVEDCIRENVEGLTPPFQWTRLEGGHSNLTYQLQDASGARAVIRRPPQGALLPKAHDMSREWSLISGYCQVKSPTLIESANEYIQAPPIPTGCLQQPVAMSSNDISPGYIDIALAGV